MKKNFFFRILILSLSLFIFNSAVSYAENLNKVSYQPNSLTFTLPQDAFIYLPHKNKTKRILPKPEQTKQSKQYLEKYFAPWNNGLDPKNQIIRQQRNAIYQSIKNDLSHFSNNLTWGENFLPHDSAWLDKLEKQMDLASYPSKSQNAITIQNTVLRVFPTYLPAFYNFNKAGEGYPFDHLQNSSLWVGTPLHIIHQSLEGDWVLAISGASFGWIPIQDIAYVNKRFIKKWQKGQYIVPTEEAVAIKDNKGIYRFKTHIGMLFPLKSGRSGSYNIYIPIAEQNRNAKLIKATLSKSQSTPYPLIADYEMMAKEINQMLGESYGWGGLYGHRDCSQTLHDYFATFGIWLPRQSTQQLNSGQTFSLAKLSDKEKERFIIDKGIPYLTLIGRPGHVMLYIGEQNGKVLVFHNKWGLPTHYPNQNEGRLIMGKSAITDLHTGENLSYTDSLMKSVQLMTIIVAQE